MEMPCPPEHVFRWKTMLLPLLIARQSSWFMILLVVLWVSLRYWGCGERGIPVLDGQVCRAHVKAVGVVSGCLAAAVCVWLVTER